MSAIVVQHLVKSFDGANAVDDISFSAKAGEILVIVGASGCGKTTTLRCIAGLERPSSGTILIGGDVVASDTLFIPPEKRGIGMVFQSYALWPHMTVYDNIAYGLVVRKAPTHDIREAVGRVIELVGLRGMEQRYPSTLSGGQQQRVALARSAVAEPKLLLLDEPLSNLDAKLREQMRSDLRALIRKLGMTAVHITHDQTEAMAIADYIIYMRDGRIEQEGTPRDLYRRPASRSAADFIGGALFFDGTVTRKNPDGAILVRIADGVELWSYPPNALPEGTTVTLAIRPDNVAISSLAPAGPVANVLKGVILDETFLGEQIEYTIETDGLRLKARGRDDEAPGARVFVVIDPHRVICLTRT